MKNSPKNIIDRGFTLVETLVAVLMLSVVMVAITSLLTRSLQAISSSQDYFIASKLALEGIEMIRTKRNNNLISIVPNGSITWNSNLTTGDYEFDSLNTTALQPGQNLPALSGTPRTLCVSTADTSSGRYVYTCGANTVSLQGNFTRTITISDPDPLDPWLQVTVSVTSSSLTTPYVLSTMLYNAS